MSKLKDNIPYMTNSELSALARNRFIDTETQLALIDHGYLPSRKYLAANPGLVPKARDLLIQDRANSVRITLVESRALDDFPELISKVYKETPSRFWTPWRLGTTFIGYRFAAPNTPPTVLKDIYLRYYRPAEENNDGSHFHSLGYRFGHDGYWSEKLMKHPNVTEEIAVLVSTSPSERAKKAAFDRLVLLRGK